MIHYKASVSIFFIIGAFLIGCSNSAYDVNFDRQAGNLIYPGEQIDTLIVYPEISRIVNTTLVVDWCTDIILNPHLQKDFELSKTLLNGISHSLASDSVLSYVRGKSNVRIHKQIHHENLMNSALHESSILLSERIHVGSTREVVMDVLKRKFGNKTLTVMSQDGTRYFELCFNKNVLDRIIFTSLES
jgi:hypothetical protein